MLSIVSIRCLMVSMSSALSVLSTPVETLSEEFNSKLCTISAAILARLEAVLLIRPSWTKYCLIKSLVFNSFLHSLSQFFSGVYILQNYQKWIFMIWGDKNEKNEIKIFKSNLDFFVLVNNSWHSYTFHTSKLFYYV